MSGKTIACGGCGEADPEKRCIGCLHDFGNSGSAWVNLPEAATALAESQATIARQQALLDRALEQSFNDKARADRMEAALREAEAYLAESYSYDHSSDARMVIRAALTDKPDAGEGE